MTCWIRAHHFPTRWLEKWSGGSFAKLQADRKRCSIAVDRCCYIQHESIATTTEDPIMLISRGARTFRGVRTGSMGAIRQLIIEVQLGRKFEAPLGDRCGANLEMNVYRPAGIPSRIHGDKPSLTVRIGHLVAT